MSRSKIEAKWNTLTARERDAWVAEVVMSANVIDGYFIERTDDGMRPVPNYTTDISAAWAVVEQFTTEVLVRRLGYGFYRCWIQQRSDSVDAGYHATKRTAPEAICLAALIAKLTDAAEVS